MTAISQGPETPAGVTVIGNIAYGSHDQKLDLYRPDFANGPLPIVIWIHGGGWARGSKTKSVFPLFLTKSGFALASLDYRLSTEATFPAQIEDCLEAVAFLKTQAETYGLDSERFAAIGESAGGTLASLLGTGITADGSNETFLKPAPPQVRAVVDYCGPADLMEDLDAIPESGSETDLERMLGGSSRQRRIHARAASPVTHVSAQTSPFLIIHGLGDPVVPIAQSRWLHAALQSADVPCELVTVPVDHHVGPIYWSETYQDKVISFLRKFLCVQPAG
jgi:acetyl esterase/lipase